MNTYYNRDSGFLFSTVNLSETLSSLQEAMLKEIEQIDANTLLDTAPTNLVEYLVGKYSMDAPILHPEDWSMTEDETQIDVRLDRRRSIRDRSRPCYVPGQYIEVEVPFEGDGEFMYVRASRYSHDPPQARISGNSLLIGLNIPHDSTTRNYRDEIDNIVKEIERHLDWVREDLNRFNQTLQPSADRAITARRNRILANQGRAASLGIPLKVRSNTPKTYALPEVRRKLAPSLPPATTEAFQLEPTLDNDNYEHILSVIQNMSRVMEYSPSAFTSMKEEDLRVHFLVQLNGHFEGAATGETFNVNGKTDILLRAHGRNAFIAECKFWNGPKQYRETIDQLLGYTAWRDTKTAIIVFNRDTAMSTVLQGIDDETTSHKNFKRKIEWNHESGFRYIFHHTNDTNREFTLTVLVFDIPSST